MPNFLDLPRELGNAIYDHVASQTPFTSYGSENTTGHDGNLNLGLAIRQLQDEFSELCKKTLQVLNRPHVFWSGLSDHRRMY